MALALNRHNIKLGIIVFFACSAVLILLWQVIGFLRGPGGNTHSEWFFDLNTGKLFTGYSNEIPPIDAPSGPTRDGVPAGVLAHVFTVGDSTDTKDQVIAYLETSHPKGLQAAIDEFGEARRVITYVKRVEDAQWVTSNSREGRAVMDAYRRRYADQLASLKECRP